MAPRSVFAVVLVLAVGLGVGDAHAIFGLRGKQAQRSTKPKQPLTRFERGVVKAGKWMARLYVGATLGTMALNAAMPASSEKTIVYSAYHLDDEKGKDMVPTWLATKINEGMLYVPIVLRQNLLGRKVEWKSNVKLSGIFSTIGDSAYKNVVFVGHGERGGFWAEDGMYYSSAYYGNAKKDGELIQLTCGGASWGVSFPSKMLTDSTRSFEHHEIKHVYDNIIDSWKLVGNAVAGGDLSKR